MRVRRATPTDIPALIATELASKPNLDQRCAMSKPI